MTANPTPPTEALSLRDEPMTNPSETAAGVRARPEPTMSDEPHCTKCQFSELLSRATTAETLAADLQGKLDEAEAERFQAVQRAQRLEAALTPSAVTKAALIGEFNFVFAAHDKFGNEVRFTPNVPWTTIKQIMAAIRSLANPADREKS